MTEQVNKLAEQEGNDLEQYFSESSLESYIWGNRIRQQLVKQSPFDQ